MYYCGNGSSLSDTWDHKGFYPCFLDSLTSSLLAGIIFIFGTIEIVVFRRYSTSIERWQRPKSKLYYMQISLTLIMASMAIVRIVLQHTSIEPKVTQGYQILTVILQSSMWLFTIVLICLERKRMLPTIPTRGHGAVLLLFWTVAFALEFMPLLCWFDDVKWFWQTRSYSNNVRLGLWIQRITGCLLLFILGLVAPGLPTSHNTELVTIVDTEGLLTNEQSIDGSGGSNGGDNAASGSQDKPNQPLNQNQKSTWADVIKKSAKILPFVWPKKSFALQLCVIFCVLLLVAGRVVNLFTPLYYKKIVDSLTITNGSKLTVEEGTHLVQAGPLKFRWDYILIYVGLRFLQGGGFGTMGLLNNARSFFWIWVQQYTTKEVGVKLFSHLHGLSLRWHLGRKTGEVLRVMDRGTNSMNNLLSYVVFNILPTIADIAIAVVYFLTSFNAWFALIVFTTMALYLLMTILITEWRTKFRREMNLLDNKRNAIGVDSLLNFETVKYYGAEDFEVDQYREAIVKYQKSEWVTTASLNLLSTAQNIIITGGLLAGSLLCAWYVVDNKGLTVGDYVLFSTYMVQLYGPLNWFGTYYRMIQQSFIDMENMFDLLEEKKEIKDEPDAPALQVSKGLVEFNKVNFFYDPRQPILKDVSFVVPPGQTFALVGHSGAGKSTIIRLLFRFYDIQGGKITLDGQNIKKIKQSSLRKAIGVVPQDTVLFNNDIKYNIRYGRVTAEDDELEEAARAADIHERIQGFVDGYATMVGERGLKLSGGEKQRVAIARTILKNPAFVLLDEATSALDTQAERNIQHSLAKVCENRTTIIVAHRLSTVIHADQILVLKEGEIEERGTHEELLEKEGLYADMWKQQQTRADETESETDQLSSGEEHKK